MNAPTPTIHEALKPFAKVAEHDIGTDEADADFFRPMDRHNRAPRLTVGDLRRARAALEALPAPSGESVTVPRVPTEAMWGGLARDIIQWSRSSATDGSGLHQHLRHLGRVIPDWLADFIPDVAHAPSKGNVVAAIYCAMLEAAPVLAPTADEGGAVAWRDIKSAPRDGTVVWLFQPHDMGGFMFAGAINADGVWINNLDLKVQNPKHWMPLPDAPSLVDRAEIDRETAEAGEAGAGPVGEAVAEGGQQ